MIPRTYKILLIVSIVFNIAFIGGYIYQRVYRPLMPPRDIPFNLRNNLAEQRTNLMPLRQDYMDCRNQFMLELAKPNVTRQQLEQKLEETLQKQMKMERQVGLSLIKMRLNMSEQQAKEFFEERRMPHHRNPRRFKNQN